MAQLTNLTTTLALESASFVNGIEQSRGAVRRLVASLDPAAAAQAKFNRQMDLAERGLKSGQLSADLYARVVDRLKQQFDSAAGSGVRLAHTNGELRSGMQQLSYQVSDVAQGFAMGTPPMVIFAQQGGQVIQAIQIMTAESKGFLAVLGGPWGIALSAAVSVVIALTGAMHRGADAQKDHAAAADSLKQAIDRLNNAAASANHTTRQGIVDDLNAAEAARRHEIAVRGLLAAQLAQARQKLSDAQYDANVAGGGTVPGASGMLGAMSAASTQAQIAAIEGAQKLNAAKLAAAQSAIAIANSRLVMRDVAASTDKATAATQRYEDAIDKLERKFESGGFGNPNSASAKSAFANAAEAATKARDATLDAIQQADHAASAARRKAAQEARAAAREAVQEAKATAKLIADASADAFKSVSGMVDDRDKAFLKGFADDAGQWDKVAKQADTAFKAQEELQLQNAEDLRRKRMQDERDIAGLYQDLFTGGTKRIWEDFQQFGFSVISQLLAKWTVGQASGISGGTGGGLLGGLGKLFGIGGGAVSGWLNGGSSAGLGFGGSYTSIAGFANGGSFEFGGKSGIDQNVLSLNGSPIARVSKGETATISNGRASNDNASSIHITVNAEGAVLTDTVKTWVAVGVASGLQEHDRQKAKKAGRSFR